MEPELLVFLIVVLLVLAGVTVGFTVALDRAQADNDLLRKENARLRRDLAKCDQCWCIPPTDFSDRFPFQKGRES